MGKCEENDRLDAKSIYAGIWLAWAIAVAMLLVVPGPEKIYLGSRAFAWREQVCVVETTSFDESSAQVPALLVTVRYEAAGRPCRATRRLSGDSRQELQDRADLFFQRGHEVDCRVNPRRPAEMILDDEYIVFEFSLFAVVATTLVCAIAAPLVCWWIRKDKAPAAARLQFLLRKFTMMFVCGFILVFCGTATVTGIGDAIRMLSSLNWPETEATIRTSSVTKVRDGKSWDYQLDLRYTYDFEGRHYEGRRWSLDDDNTATRMKMRKALRGLKGDDVVSCYVNPKDPTEAILDRQVWSLLAIPLLPVVLVAAAYGFLSALREKAG